MLDKNNGLERSEFSFVSMALRKPSIHPRVHNNYNTEKPPHYSPPILEEKPQRPPAKPTDSQPQRSNSHVTFSSDVEDYQTSFDYQEEDEDQESVTEERSQSRSFGSATSSQSSSSRASDYWGGNAYSNRAGANLERNHSGDSTKADSIYPPDGTKSNDNKNKNNNNNNSIPPLSSPRRVQQKYQTILSTIRTRRRRHKEWLHQYYDARPSSPCIPFLLVLGGAALLLTILALVPHIRADANSSTHVYYDSYQGKDVVVRNDDAQLTLLVLALGCMAVLLGGSLCYCASVVMDDDNNDNDGKGGVVHGKEGDGIVLSSMNRSPPKSSKCAAIVDEKNSDQLLPK